MSINISLSIVPRNGEMNSSFVNPLVAQNKVSKLCLKYAPGQNLGQLIMVLFSVDVSVLKIFIELIGL